MSAEYDFAGGVRGKYAERFAAGTNVIVLDDDVAALFPTSVEVNDALRLLARLARRATANRTRAPRTTKPVVSSPKPHD